MPCPREVRDLRYSYPGAQEGALRGVSFSLAAGEKAALVGPNGSGKSTLLLHLAGALPLSQRGALPASQGAILLHGEDASPEHLREAVGLIFQEPDDQLLMPTVVEDVAFGLVARGVPLEEARARALQSLASLGVAHLADRPPHRLSGGEKRRVSLAGILVMEPEVLVLDEPINGLDPQGIIEIRELILKLNREQKITVLLSSHI